ncbi:MAG: structural protein [Caudoviricetes sp.]|nr:MAG: structural protein [Caudoviricetes sp.]
MSCRCEYCDKKNCFGECQNYLIEMIKNGVGHDDIETLLMQLPKVKYALTAKINSIFGTEIEVCKNSDRLDDKTFAFKQFLYKKNRNNKTNLAEIKKALWDKEVFGKAYCFFESTENGNNLYYLSQSSVNTFIPIEKDSIIQEVSYYTVGEPTITDKIDWKEHKDGYIKYDGGYIIKPSNMLVFESDTFVLNSDLMQLQNLLQINKKINESTTYRDYGNVFVFPNGKIATALSATGNRIKEEMNKAVKAMRDKVAKLIKKDNTKDSNVIVLDEQYQKIEQIKPLTKITEYQFYWEKQDDIISSVVNFPAILMNMGNVSGDVSKVALIKDARANFLTPLKNDTANILTTLCDKLFDEDGYYIRFEDYKEIEV